MFQQIPESSPGEISSGEKKPPENMFDKFSKLQKFFPTGNHFGKLGRVCPVIVMSKVFREIFCLTHFVLFILTD